MIGNDLRGQRVLRIEGLQLQQQAFAQIPRAHSDGIEILHHRQRVLQIVLRILPPLRDLFHRRRQVTVLVQVPDDIFRDSFTVSVQIVTLSCHIRWSVSPAEEERNFSKEGRSEISRSCDWPPSPPVSKYWLKKVPTSNSSNGFGSGFSGSFSVSFFRKFSSL